MVVQQRNVRRAIRIVLDRRDRRRNAILVTLEVYEPVAPLVPTADMTGGNAAVVVPPARLVKLGEQLLLRLLPCHRVARQDRGVPPARSHRFVTSCRHPKPPRITLYARPRRAGPRPSSKSPSGPAKGPGVSAY